MCSEISAAGLFRPDLFSDGKPAFVPAPPESGRAAKAVLTQHYPALGPAVGEVRQSGSIELNSNNFLVETATGRFIAKRWPPGATRLENDERMRQARLASWLAGQGIPLPRVFLASAGQPIVEQDGCAWCVMAYVDGEYFFGKGGELHEAGTAMRRLFLALGHLPAELRGGQIIEPPGQDSLELIRKLDQDRGRWADVFGASYARLLADAWEHITATLAAVTRARATSGGPPVPCHIDLHPHNLLMRGGRLLAILDSGSLVRAVRTTIIAFNLFKLARQAVVARAGDASESGFRSQLNAVIQGMLADGLLDGAARDAIALHAQAEIMRRLLLILSLGYERNDRDWLHVLPIQVLALREAEVVFS